ncbi:hypothetical protein C3H55_08355 [Campylobacter jejuni]|uniref:hypothetical protein n=1 Tax=Campylobacter jejuni TaxID=197 RepID=UPI000F80B404|nr:hypothetical protein [Campylobacter jejuni]RTJ67135.1 hypothetical protein C3H55_08355 [Campylobacter jejuni]HEF7932360.1 hypothetical protein [Campylobacter jejuni]
MGILEKMTYQDEKENLLVLEKIVKLLNDYIYEQKNIIYDKFDLIFKRPEQFNDEYIISHYLSICRAIKSVNENRYLVCWEIASGIPQTIITQTIIYDIARFYNAIRGKEKSFDKSLQSVVMEINNIIGSIQGLDDDIHPQRLFNYSFGCYLSPYPKFYISLIEKAFLIRMALERKIKWMIFGDLQEREIKLHDFLLKLKENHKQYFDLPPNVDFDKIMLVKNWCNRIIHDGLFPYIWVVWDAIEIMEPLFHTSNKEKIDLEGFHYRKDITQDISKFF